MRKILAILKLKLLLLRNNWTMLLMMTVTPIIFTLAIGNMHFGASELVSLYFVDQDQSTVSAELLQAFDPEIYELNVVDDAALFRGVRDDKIQVGYIIPAGFGAALLRGEQVEIQIVRDPDQMSQQEVPTILNSAALRLQSREKTSVLVLSLLDSAPLAAEAKTELTRQVVQTVDYGWDHPVVRSQFEQVTTGDNFEVDQKAQSSIGYLIFFMMFTLTFGINEILDEKHNGTWARVMTTPTRSAQILSGHFLGTMLIGAVQAIILVAFGQFVMGVQWGRSVMGVLLMLLALIFALTSLGLALAGMIQTRRQLQALYPVLIVSTSMLGGCMWPLEIVPPLMQKVALFIPQGQAMMGLTDLIMRGAGFLSVLPHFFALLGLGVIFFTIGVVKIQQRA